MLATQQIRVLLVVRLIHTHLVVAQQRTPQAQREILVKQAQAVVAEIQMPEAQAQPVAQEHNPEAVAVVVAAV
jgi:hypothetical protein